MCTAIKPDGKRLSEREMKKGTCELLTSCATHCGFSSYLVKLYFLTTLPLKGSLLHTLHIQQKFLRSVPNKTEYNWMQAT